MAEAGHVTTELTSDWSRMPHLGPEIFLGRSRVSALYLNNSNIQGGWLLSPIVLFSYA